MLTFSSHFKPRHAQKELSCLAVLGLVTLGQEHYLLVVTQAAPQVLRPVRAFFFEPRALMVNEPFEWRRSRRFPSLMAGRCRVLALLW